MKKNSVNLINLWKLNKRSKTPFLGSPEYLSNFPFMEEYLANYSRIDRDFIVTRGFFFPIWNRQYESSNNDVLTQFKEDVEDLIFRNKNTYQRLYDIAKSEYNPIENYNMEEKGTDNTGRTNKLTSDFGQENETMNYGNKSTSEVHGAQTTTEDHGAQSGTSNIGAYTETTNIGGKSQNVSHGGHNDTQNIGAQSVTTTKQIAGFNGGFSDSEKDTQSTSARSDSSSIGAYTDTTTDSAQENKTSFGAHTDTTKTDGYTDVIDNAEYTNSYSENEHSDTHTKNAKQDVHNTEEKTDYTHNFSRHGNIGVTTTTQMIEGEVSLWTAFNFYKMIYEDIVKELCIFYDEGIDAFCAGFDMEDDDMEIGNDQITAKVEQTPDGCIITITDSTGTSTAKITNGTNGKDGITPKFKVESDGDIFVDYSGEEA